MDDDDVDVCCGRETEVGIRWAVVGGKEMVDGGQV